MRIHNASLLRHCICECVCVVVTTAAAQSDKSSPHIVCLCEKEATFRLSKCPPLSSSLPSSFPTRHYFLPFFRLLYISIIYSHCCAFSFSFSSFALIFEHLAVVAIVYGKMLKSAHYSPSHSLTYFFIISILSRLSAAHPRIWTLRHVGEREQSDVQFAHCQCSTGGRGWVWVSDECHWSISISIRIICEHYFRSLLLILRY